MASAIGQPPLWEPSTDMRERAQLTRFMRWLAGGRAERHFDDYEGLWEWSVSEPEQFWAAIWDYCGVRHSCAYERVLDSREMPGARWFEGAELNYAENLLSRERDPGAVAILHASELRELDSLTWAQLREQVAQAAAGLRELGVGRGDRVVAYMPNIPETLVAFLATASIGAIFSSAAPEFGARSVIDRFAQIAPMVLLAVDGYRHGGKNFDRMEAVRTIARELPGLRHTVLLPYLAQAASASGAVGAASAGKGLRAGVPPGPGAGAATRPAHDGADREPGIDLCTTDLPGALSWSELLTRGRAAAGASAASFEQLPFEHPLWVLYSSGTTGLPKAIVHSHGGILLEQLKKSWLHLDLHAGDRMFWFTTTGWMMWNFLIGCLLSDASIILYDGSPSHPDLGALWRLAERTEMTCMGVSAGLLGACAKAGVEPARDFDLHALRAIGSTGSPLPPESFRWVYEHVGRDQWLFSTSGGTDVCTAFVGGCPLLPVYEGELQCRALGCAVRAFDERGRSVIEQVGELVITAPMPSMPIFFWGEDPPRPGGGGERYRESYFSMYPGVWRHGDWIRITTRGGAVIYGRSDATINRQGVRMGTSEIYRAAEAVEEVLDALVVDVPMRAAGVPVSAAGAATGAAGVPVSAADAATGAAGVPVSAADAATGAAGVPASAAGPAAGIGRGGIDTGAELRMILFVVLREGATLDDRLRARIVARIREDCSPRHVPNEILQIAEVPRTLSGKALEVPVKKILMGVSPATAASVDSLANPRSLDFFVELASSLNR